MSLRIAAFATLALTAAVGSFVHAAKAPQQADAVVDRLSVDLMSNLDRESTRSALPPIAGAAALTVDEVGDPDSFGHVVKWLGVAQGDIIVTADCAAMGTLGPNTRCVQSSATPGLMTSFAFDGLDAISLPRGASESLLCHMFSPLLSVQYENPTAGPGLALLRYQPTLTIESPVLDNPALINPQTGLPFGGSLRTGMSAAEFKSFTLGANEYHSETSRDTAACIAGFLTKRSLVEVYGLTEAQARQVFRKPITIRLNVSGSVRFVQEASLIFGLRVTGDGA